MDPVIDAPAPPGVVLVLRVRSDVRLCVHDVVDASGARVVVDDTDILQQLRRQREEPRGRGPAHVDLAPQKEVDVRLVVGDE